MARCQKKCVRGERLREGIKCAEDKTKEQHTSAESYAHMTIVCKSFVSRIMNLKICVKNSFSHGIMWKHVGFWLLDLQELNLSGEVECDLEVSNCAQIALAYE